MPFPPPPYDLVFQQTPQLSLIQRRLFSTPALFSARTNLFLASPNQPQFINQRNDTPLLLFFFSNAPLLYVVLTYILYYYLHKYRNPD